MLVNNKLDNTFGPFGVFAGIVVLLFGIYSCFYNWIGLTTVVVGIFLAFSSTSTKIDFANKRAKFSNNIFGIFKIGYWTEIKPEMSLIIQKTARKRLGFNQSNESQTQAVKDFRIMLINEKGSSILALKKFRDKDKAETELKQIAEKLNVNI
ncbi:MAG: hypothetical protein PHP52_03040 [Bacteroidales bacterium]|nr:hypothetical protein [Bacteroidales bacterium]MDD4216241.1 hypothetical protein [Bacteroidales bacterium]MDY0141399.1 hypothetical protein [Bacteroidales bacterium]